MKCPHCQVAIHEGFASSSLVQAGNSNWLLLAMTCPSCAQAILKVRNHNSQETYSAYPRDISSRPLPQVVPEPYKADFCEAVDVLPISAKASAALTRRSLQSLLINFAGATPKADLVKQIEEAIASGKLPSHLNDGLHGVRNIGNFAAHEQKSKATGEILDVEPGEADWNLDTLESLYDFYFVEPAKSAKRKADLNIRLKAAGKPEIP